MNNALRALAKSIPEDYDVGSLLLSKKSDQHSSHLPANDELLKNLNRKARADYTIFADFVEPPTLEMSDKYTDILRNMKNPNKSGLPDKKLDEVAFNDKKQFTFSNADIVNYFYNSGEDYKKLKSTFYSFFS